jgi:hypothetical protein
MAARLDCTEAAKATMATPHAECEERRNMRHLPALKFRQSHFDLTTRPKLANNTA